MGSEPGQMSNPVGVAVDAENNIICVSHYSNNRVSIYDSSGEFIRMFPNVDDDNKGRKNPGRLSNPWGLTVDSVGNIIVADQCTLSTSLQMCRTLKRCGIHPRVLDLRKGQPKIMRPNHCLLVLANTFV
jgi:DNA-binding beta-propeller fold protein YncE